MIAIVDAGPLYAGVNANDSSHERCREVLARQDLRLVVPTLVIAEVAYLIARDIEPRTEAMFIRGLADVEIEPPTFEDWPAIANLIERYADFPLGTTDASVAVLAERLDTNLIITLDRRHFGAIQMPSGMTFRILPD